MNMEPDKETIDDALQTKCKSCGGYAQYSPADENLKCTYCGAITELDKTPAENKGNDFHEWKNKADEDKADSEALVEATEIKCRQCGAHTTLPANTSGAKCAFCSTPLILSEAHIKRFWQPEYVLPFKVTEKQSSANFKNWLGKRWFLPTIIKKHSVRPESFKGVYLPFWTYDSNTYTEYTGQKGVNRRVKKTDASGKIVEKTETDWFTAYGAINQSFKDIPIAASKTLPPKISNKLTNWDMKNSVNYQKEFLAGFITEIYQKDFRDGVHDAKKKMDEIIKERIEKDIGGDKQRILSKDTNYNDLKFKLLLLPIWISSFQYNGKLYQFVVNGRTGDVIGEYPQSKVKIFLFILMIVAIIYILYKLLTM